MSLSNQNGRALEFAYLIVFDKMIENAKIEQNSSFFASKSAWDASTNKAQETFIASATAGIKAVFDAEPLISEGSTILLKIQPDQKGKDGDVRDILAMRSEIGWEIGLSVKNNHSAVKHSRLSKRLDFGEKWFGVPCSSQYWNNVEPIFEYLANMKKKGTEWKELPSKENDVYVPLLKAFLDEVKQSYAIHSKILPQRMVEYLIGKYDFYKAIGRNNKRITQFQSYNSRGTLNKPSSKKKPKLLAPIASLPSRILHADFKPNSTNTVEICMDEGWQFSFRIHNAATKVEASLKFDIQIVGMPANIICIDYKWE